MKLKFKDISSFTQLNPKYEFYFYKYRDWYYLEHLSLLDGDFYKVVYNLNPNYFDKLFQYNNIEVQTNLSKFKFLKHYQVEFIETVLNFLSASRLQKLKHIGYLLQDDVGLGKTAQQLTLQTILLENIPNQIVVLFTNISLKKQFLEEIKKFELPLQTFVVNNKYDLYQLNEMLENRTLIQFNTVLLHYEVLKNSNDVNGEILNDFYRTLSKFNFVFFILDEQTKVKNDDTHTYKMLFNMITSTKRSFTLVVTATPVENNLYELSNIMKLQFGGNLFSSNWVTQHFVVFREIKVNTTKKFNQIKVIDKYKNLDIFKEMIQPLMIKRTKSQVNLKLPTLHEYYTRINTIDKYQIEQIKLLKEDIESVQEWNEFTKQMVLYGYVRQVMNSLKIFKNRVSEQGFILNDNINRLQRFKEYILNINLSNYYSPKETQLNNLLIDIFQTTNNKKVVVFTFYEQMMKILYDNLSRVYKNVFQVSGSTSVHERNKIIDKCKQVKSCILIQTDSLSYGVNLQFIDYMINFDQPYNPSKLYQRIGRIHRIGSQNEKIVYNLYTPLEERVIQILKKKYKLMSDLNLFESNNDLYKKVMYDISKQYYELIKKLVQNSTKT